MDTRTFVALLAEDNIQPTSKDVLKISLEKASPTDRPEKEDKMVQVANNPYDNDDEEQAMLQGNAAQNVTDDLKSNRISSVTDEAYKTVASSMMADPINQTNPIIALNLLETALINRNVPLAKHYITNLNQLIQKDNALKILHSIGKWIHTTEADQQLNFEPSAPPLVDNDDERNDNWMKEPLNHVRENILLEIDKSGDHFLKQKELQDLHYQDVLDITTRDSLQVSNELIVYSAIMRWAVTECHRKGLVPEDVNVRAVLKDLIHAPRYGLMSKKEFRARTVDGYKGPDRIGMPTDINEKILHYIMQKEKKKKDIDDLPYKMSRGRKSKSPKHSSSDHPVKEKVIINCLTCFTAVFD